MMIGSIRDYTLNIQRPYISLNTLLYRLHMFKYGIKLILYL